MPETPPEIEELQRRVARLEGESPLQRLTTPEFALGTRLADLAEPPLDYFNVLDYGARADGLSDDTGAIQRALDAANTAGGGRVHLPRGNYRVDDQLALYANTMLQGEGGQSIITWAGGASASEWLLQALGTASADKSLTANAAEGDTALTVGSGDEAVAADGDYVLIHSAKVWTTDGNILAGEIQQVTSVSDGTINLHDPLVYAYATANTAKVRKITFVENIGVCDLRVEGLLDGGEAEQGAFLFQYCRNVTLSGLTIMKVGRYQTYIDRCLDVSVSQCRFHHTSPANQGYGVLVAGATQHVSVVGNHFNECRHAVAGGGVASVGGVPRFVTITGNTVRNPASTGIDSHGSEYWTVADNVITGGTSFGVHTTGANWIVTGNIIKNCAGGIKLKDYTVDRPRSYIVANNHVETNNGEGIFLTREASSSTVQKGSTVTGNRVINYHASTQTNPLYKFDGLQYLTVTGNVGLCNADGTDNMQFLNCDLSTIMGNALLNGTNGIHLDVSCTYNTIIGNMLSSMSTNAILNDGGAGHKIAHNIGDATHNE